MDVCEGEGVVEVEVELEGEGEVKVSRLNSLSFNPKMSQICAQMSFDDFFSKVATQQDFWPNFLKFF